MSMVKAIRHGCLALSALTLLTFAGIGAVQAAAPGGDVVPVG